MDDLIGCSGAEALARPIIERMDDEGKFAIADLREVAAFGEVAARLQARGVGRQRADRRQHRLRYQPRTEQHGIQQETGYGPKKLLHIESRVAGKRAPQHFLYLLCVHPDTAADGEMSTVSFR